MTVMNDIFPLLFNCFVALLLITFVFSAAIKSDRIYQRLAAFVMRKMGRALPALPEAALRAAFREPASLPGCAAAKVVIYAPALAAASLVTLCASLPFCTFIPIIDNGADIIQMAQLLLLSEAFAVAALCSLGTKEGCDFAAAEAKAALKLLVPLAASAASLSFFFTQNGVDRDPFSLNSFSVVGRFSAMSPFGIFGSLLFAFIILSQIPHRGTAESSELFEASEMPDFKGAPRALLQLWSIARSFIIISVVVFVFFPHNIIENIGESVGIAWYRQALSFAAFWLAVVLARLFIVPLCQFAMNFIERRTSEKYAEAAMPLLLAASMALLWYEGLLLSQEAALF